jgi:surface protein
MKTIILLFSMLLVKVSYSQTPITNVNFQNAVFDCLTTNPVDGLCNSSQYGPMPDWDVSQVTEMPYALSSQDDFNGDISSWDVSSVTDMNNMFAYSGSFNRDLSSWDVSSVTNMNNMFYITGSFNQDISNWCVTNIGSVPTNFSALSPLSESNKPTWGNCPTASLENQDQTAISIYPNPTSNIVYIDGNNSQLEVVVYDVLGKQVMGQPTMNTIDISQLSKGVYIFQLSDGVKLTTQRIIKN